MAAAPWSATLTSDSSGQPPSVDKGERTKSSLSSREASIDELLLRKSPRRAKYSSPSNGLGLESAFDLASISCGMTSAPTLSISVCCSLVLRKHDEAFVRNFEKTRALSFLQQQQKRLRAFCGIFIYNPPFGSTTGRCIYS